MNPKFLILYVIAATISLLLMIYQFIAGYPVVNFGRVALNAIVSLFFYYLAYKTYHIKKDSELM